MALRAYPKIHHLTVFVRGGCRGRRFICKHVVDKIVHSTVSPFVKASASANALSAIRVSPQRSIGCLLRSIGVATRHLVPLKNPLLADAPFWFGGLRSDKVKFMAVE